MKKVLIASTALVAAGLLTPGVAAASEKIKLQLGGYSKWWVVGKWNDDNYQNSIATTAAVNPASYNNVDVIGDNEIHFVGSTTLDNGLKVGIQVELEAGGHSDMSSDTIDASFVFVEGGFGKVMLGAHNNGTYLLHVMAPDAAANWGEGGLLQSGVAIAQPAAVKSMPYWNANTGAAAASGNTTNIVTDNKSEKITYVAPTFFGLTVGASYIPNLAEDTRAVTINDTEAYGAGALYANTFGGVGVKVSGGYVAYDVNPGDGSAKTTDRSFEWSTGGQLSYAGFTLGGSFRKAQTNFVSQGTTGATSSGASSTVSAAGEAWDAGLSYANGPYAVSFAYFSSNTQGDFNSATSTGDDEIEIYQVSAKYTMGPGVDLLGSIGHAEYTDETTNVSNNNKGWAVMTGLSLAF
jgi:predicted porin